MDIDEDDIDFGRNDSKGPRRLTTTLSFTVPQGGASKALIRQYIQEALSTWGGQFHLTHPLCESLRNVSVTNLQEQDTPSKKRHT